MTDQIKTSTGAIWSLVLGILGLCCLGPLGAIPAIICGHVSLAKINRSAGALAGQGLAIAGFVLGYLGLALSIFVLPLLLAIAIPSFMRARTTAQANGCINNLRMIESAKDQYALEAGLTNGAVITFDKIGPSGKGYLKSWPLCPAAKHQVEKNEATQAVAESDYVVNPVGVNAACKNFQDAKPAHRLKTDDQLPR